MDKSVIVERIIGALDIEAQSTTTDKSKEEILQEKDLFRDLDIQSISSTVELGSLVRLSCNDMSANYFVSASGNGNILEVNGSIVVILSVFSPLGASVLARSKGESFEVDIRGHTKVYKVENIH